MIMINIKINNIINFLVFSLNMFSAIKLLVQLQSKM